MKHNRADIKRDEFTDHPLQANAKANIKIAGTNLAPWGFEYEGSAVVHFYKAKGTHNYVFISHLVDLDSVPEGQADVGLKELRKSLMKAYGREDKKRSDTKEEML